MLVQSPTLPVRFFYTVSPGKRLSILKGSATRAGGAIVSHLLNWYILSGGNSCKMWSGSEKHREVAIQKAT